MTKSGSSGSEGVTGTRRARFNRWRRTRPFAGGVLLILASFIIAWVPIHIAPSTILLGRALAPIGLLFAALVFMCGVFALTRPAFADIFGIFGVMFTVFSLYGALAGLFIGLIPGIFGGVLCYAWRPEDGGTDGSDGSGGSDDSDTADEKTTITYDEEESSEDDSDRLFGSRSVRSITRNTTASETTGVGGRTASVAILVITVVVLGAFVHPFVAAAAQPFPEETQTGGTVIIAEEFSGTFYDHQNVTTDTSDRTGVPAAQLSFKSAEIQGLTIYKNFRSGPQTPYYISITGTSASANGLSITASEVYFGKLHIGKDPVIIPTARKKWTTCPGKDFLLSVSDLGPLSGPSIDASNVVFNTHQTTAGSLTIKNFRLTVEKGVKSTSVSGTPECTTKPIEPVLELFTANALELLVDNGIINSTVVANTTVANLTAPETVNQSETFTVSATVTNTGYANSTMTVEYRFDGAVKQTKNVTLGHDESTTVTFEDTANVSEGTYKFGVFLNNGSATGSITVGNETDASGNASTTTANVTDTAGNASTVDSQTAPNASDASVGSISTQAAALQTPTGRNTMAGGNTNGGTGTTMTAATGTNGMATTPQASATATTGNRNSSATASTGKSLAAQSVPQTSSRGPSTTNTNGGKTTTVTKTPTASPTPIPVVSSSISGLTGPDRVKQGRNFTVTAKVTNTGTKKDLTIPVNYGSPSGNNQTKKVTLDPGQTKTVAFTDTVPRNMSGGSYEYNVSTNTSSKTGTLTVPPFNTSTKVSAVSSDIDTVAPGESFDVTAKITNTGNKYGLTIPVSYEASDGMKKSQKVTLNPGETKLVTFSDIAVPGDKSGGSYEYTVSTNESSVTKNITVVTKTPTPTTLATETRASTTIENNSSTNNTTTSGTETILQSLFAGVFP